MHVTTTYIDSHCSMQSMDVAWLAHPRTQRASLIICEPSHVHRELTEAQKQPHTVFRLPDSGLPIHYTAFMRLR